MLKHLLLIIACLLSLGTLAAKEYDAEILFHSITAQASTSKLIVTDTTAIRINNRKGDHWADVALFYNRKENLSVVAGWIEDSRGNIVRKLKSSDITTSAYTPRAMFYNDEYVKTFSLKHNTYPYKVVYVSQSTKSEFLYIAQWDPSHLDIPVHKCRITVESAPDYYVNFTQDNTAEPQITRTQKSTTLSWKSSYTPIEPQIDANPTDLKAPAIYVVPTDFTYGVSGNYSGWNTFGQWMGNLNKKTDDLPQAEKQRIDQLLAGVSSQREKAKILYRDMQQRTHYILVTIDKGGFRSYPASYVTANRYGDCKALCTYMRSALKHAGITSYYTLINAGEQVEVFDEKFPMQLFNHVILTLSLDGDTVFLECTDNYRPLGYMGTFTSGRRALLIDGAQSHLIDIPPLSPPEVLVSRHIETSLAADNDTFSLRMDCRGRDYELYTALAQEVNRDRAEKYIRTQLMRRYELSDINILPHGGDEAIASFSASVKMHNLQRKYGQTLFATRFPLDLPAYEKPAERTQGLKFDYPRYNCDTIGYRFADARITVAPEDVAVESKFGHYSLTHKLEGDRMTTVKTLLLHRGTYPVEDYPQFYEFISSVRNHENMNLKIE